MTEDDIVDALMSADNTWALAKMRQGRTVGAKADDEYGPELIYRLEGDLVVMRADANIGPDRLVRSIATWMAHTATMRFRIIDG